MDVAREESGFLPLPEDFACPLCTEAGCPILWWANGTQVMTEAVAKPSEDANIRLHESAFEETDTLKRPHSSVPLDQNVKRDNSEPEPSYFIPGYGISRHIVVNDISYYVTWRLDHIKDREKNREFQRPRRRGRGERRNEGYWKEYNTKTESEYPNEPGTDPSQPAQDIFDHRECLFQGKDGKITIPALANLDTGMKIPGGLVMSSHYAKETGLYQNLSTDFVDPCMRSISGHDIAIRGIIRAVKFRLKGTSLTFIRDFFICDAIDVDIMVGASFIQEQFHLFFEKVKKCFSRFGAWFATKKESAQEREERQRRELEQTIQAKEMELKCLRREQEKLRAQQRVEQQQKLD